MLKIKAKENATIEVVDGSFPLGSRDVIKIDIEDEVLKQFIKTIGTETCLPEYNLYDYGNFKRKDSIKNIQMSLNTNSSVNIIDGYGINYSRCLHLVAGESGLGTCKLVPTTQPTKGKVYKLSCCVNTNLDNISFNINNEEKIEIPKTEDWYTISKTFTFNSDNFILSIDMPKQGELYLDNLMLFEADKEILDNKYDDIEFNIEILNPIQKTKIDEVVYYTEDCSVTLNVPPITVVDYQDNLLCQLSINILREPKEKYLGNSYYHKFKDCVYISDPFILSGYVIPSDEDVEVTLTVGKV